MRSWKYLLTLSILMLMSISPTYAAGDKKPKKSKKTEAVVLEINPDPICKKAKPDSHPRGRELPFVGAYAFGRGGRQTEGYDISHYQGNIDWSQLSNDPQCGFVYVKATEGSTIIDNTYERNINEARRYGVKVGTYHFFRANNSAREQFAIFKKVFEPQKQDLVPMVDVEVMPGGMSKSRFDDCLEDLLVLIEKEYGVRPIIYTGKNFYNKHFYGSRFRNYKFWIAAYADEQPVLTDNDDYLIWQYSAKGKAKGVKGYIDRNKFVGRHGLYEIKYK